MGEPYTSSCDHSKHEEGKQAKCVIVFIDVKAKENKLMNVKVKLTKCNCPLCTASRALLSLCRQGGVLDCCSEHADALQSLDTNLLHRRTGGVF